MIRRGLAAGVVMVCMAATLLMGADSASAQYNPTNCGFIVTPTSVTAGDTVTITGQGFPSGSTVIFTVDGIAIATTTATNDYIGAVDTTAVIPADLPTGSYVVSVDCAGVSSTQTIDVASSSSASGQQSSGTGSSGTSSGSLADTGANTMPFLKAALLLIAFGALILLSTKRGRHART